MENRHAGAARSRSIFHARPCSAGVAVAVTCRRARLSCLHRPLPAICCLPAGAGTTDELERWLVVPRRRGDDIVARLQTVHIFATLCYTDIFFLETFCTLSVAIFPAGRSVPMIFHPGRAGKASGSSAHGVRRSLIGPAPF